MALSGWFLRNSMLRNRKQGHILYDRIVAVPRVHIIHLVADIMPVVYQVSVVAM
jgi:hypothetical protein